MLLSDLRVVDLSTGIAGGYATKLFTDLGADVVKVENPEGDPLRWRRRPEVDVVDLPGSPARSGALFRHLARGKRSTVARSRDRRIADLVAGADLVVESDADRWLDPLELIDRHPRLVVLSVTPYGRLGPWQRRPVTEFIVQAESGALACRSRPDREPVQIGGRMSEWLAGVYGAAGALAAIRKSRRTGRGEHVDASTFAAINYSAAAQTRLKYETQKTPDLQTPFRFLEVPSIEPTKDGFVGFNTNSRQQFEDFLVLIDRPDLLADENWPMAGYRANHIDEWNAIVHAWTTRHTTAEVVDLASAFRIPVAPVNDASQVLEHPQLVAREFFYRSADQVIEPRSPFKIDGVRVAPPEIAPELGDDLIDDIIEQWVRPASTETTIPDSEAADALPLTGLRVLDATAWWAGPVVGLAFAGLGADVIHLESIQRPDNMRFAVGPLGDQSDWWERGYLFLGNNWNKRDLTLDLSSETGRSLFRRLVRECDVLVENYSPRVFETFGFDRAGIAEINPKIVFVRMPAFGLDGPWRDHVGFAQTMEQVTGLAWITGPPGQPTIPRGPCDPAAGYHAFFAALAALMRRDATGRGAFIESAMCEAVVAISAELTVEYSASGTVLASMGNRGPDAAPQGLYRCRGADEWLAIAIESDRQWTELVEALGRPGWASGASYKSADGRRAAHDVLDRELAAWASDKDARVATDLLIGYGVPAGRVIDPRLAPEQPQFRALGFFEEMDHPVVGPVTVAAMPFRYHSVKRWIRRPAPVLGQHNDELLTEVLGLSAADISGLAESRIIGTRPLNA